VLQLSRERLREVVDGPAARLGLTLADGLRDRLLRDVGDDPAALPLLQHVLDELWLRRDGDALTHAALDALGGADGALVRRADAVIDAMSGDERLAARRLLVSTCAYFGAPATGARRPRVEAELRPADPDRAAVWDRAMQALVDARLVVRRARDDGAGLVDISHEVLIRRWPRLWRWSEEERTFLAEQARLRPWIEVWRRAPDQLLTDGRLGFALHLREVQGDALGPAALELIAASEAADQRRRDEAQRRRDDERSRAATELARARGRGRVALAASLVLLAALVASGLQWRSAALASAEAKGPAPRSARR
jgi:hypothetical protein